MTNTGKLYEALAEQVFSRLLAQSNLCKKVERDVVLAGKSTSHQIDVAFEFEVGGMTYRTIVQCKDWSTPVKQEQVLTFHDVLCDIPGQPRGVMVARSGFQEGARKVAAHHGIKLYELREPKDEDWDGLIRTVVTTINVRALRFDDVRFILDEVAVKVQLAARGLHSMELNFNGHPSETPVTYASGKRCDLDRILNERVPPSGLGPFPVRHDFAEPVFVHVPGSPIQPLPLAALEATIRVLEERRELRVDLDHFVAYSFRDVLTGDIRFLRSDGQPMGSQ